MPFISKTKLNRILTNITLIITALLYLSSLPCFAKGDSSSNLSQNTSKAIHLPIKDYLFGPPNEETKLINIFEGRVVYDFDKKNEIKDIDELKLNTGYRYGCDPHEIPKHYWWKKLDVQRLGIYCKSDGTWLVMPGYVEKGTFGGKMEIFNGKKMLPAVDNPVFSSVYTFYGANEKYPLNNVIPMMLDKKNYNKYIQLYTRIKLISQTLYQDKLFPYSNLSNTDWIRSESLNDPDVNQFENKPFLILNPANFRKNKYELSGKMLVILSGYPTKDSKTNNNCFEPHLIYAYDIDKMVLFCYMLSRIDEGQKKRSCQTEGVINIEKLIKDILFVKTYTLN